MEKFYMWLAWQLPRELARWGFVRVVSEASTGALSDREMGTITCIEALEQWDRTDEPLDYHTMKED